MWPSVLVCVFAVAYALLTWGEPYRGVMLVGALALAAAGVLVLPRVPVKRILAGRHAQTFLIVWSGSVIAVILAACLLDGGVTSPLTSLFFLPLVYAALSYPVRTMLLVAAIDFGAFVVVALATPGAPGHDVFVLGATLITGAWICAWQCAIHERHRHELDRASRTDPLTGVLNRRGFQERFAAQLSSARRTGAELALVLIDLDEFKAVNDQHGHAAGDELLCWVTDRLTADLRAEDLVARLGGDEFALVLPGSDAAVAVGRVTRLLAERAPASAGVAVYPIDGDDPDSLHQVADARLYEHKDGRRSRARQVRAAM